ncbi:MAG: YitT family protein [Clostridiales bacterium]|nr:YitT family protein [Candidatus Cacconaster stercorequi]
MLNKALHNRPLRFLMALFGSFLLAVAINLFVSPHQLYSSGLFGTCQLICTVLHTKLGIAAVSLNLAGVLYFVLNIPLLFLAYRTLGRQFVLWLVACTVSNSLFLTIIPIPTVPIIEDMLTSCLVGGILAGFANGLVLTCGASCGGLDILGLYLSSKGSHFTVGKFSIAYNAVLYLICLLLFDASTALYSAIYTVFNSLFMDRVHRQNITVQVLIFTKVRNPELPRFIMNELGRGVTYWEAKGAYTGDNVQVLCVCLSKYEIDSLQQAMHKMDPNAFFMVQEGVHIGGNFPRHLSS